MQRDMVIVRENLEVGLDLVQDLVQEWVQEWVQVQEMNVRIWFL